MTKELYDTIQIGIFATAIATPMCVWLYGRMKYGSNYTKENIARKQQNTLETIKQMETNAEVRRVRLETDADRKETEDSIRIMDARRQMLADPNFTAYLDKREKLAKELSSRKGLFGISLYGDPRELERALDASLGENPLGEK